MLKPGRKQTSGQIYWRFKLFGYSVSGHPEIFFLKGTKRYRYGTKYKKNPIIFKYASRERKLYVLFSNFTTQYGKSFCFDGFFFLGGGISVADILVHSRFPQGKKHKISFSNCKVTGW